MTVSASQIPRGPSLWSSRLALFSLLLIVVGLILHRFLGLPTATAFNVLAVAVLGAALAILLGLYASIGVWRKGLPGAARILLGVGLGMAILLVPVLVVLSARNFPTLNDVTTDPVSPPAFRTLSALRVAPANPAEYPAEAFSRLQREAYPDLEPMFVNRPVAEAFDLVVVSLKRLNLDVVREEPPTDEVPVGSAEAVDRTLVLGFYDDVAVRVSGDEVRSRIDLRSSSRYGRSDFGQNAQRLRDIMREIVARLEATVPAAGTRKEPPANKKTVKQKKNADREKGDGRR